MIITRAPLRITLGGGGTDLPNYYRNHGGFCVSAAIDRYIFIALHQTFDQEIILKYSQIERVKAIADVQHPIIREALRMVDVVEPHLEISSHADIPAGTGLGSSSSFTVALLKALYTYRGLEHREPGVLARQACEIEIDRLDEPVGRQDQTIAAYGGLAYLTFCPDGTIEVKKALHCDFINELESNLLLFFTGHIRSASEAIKGQTLNNMDAVLASGYAAAAAIENKDRQRLCEQLNLQWDLKLERDPSLDPKIVEWRELGMSNGADAVKLIGAGKGGFLLCYASDKLQLRSAMFDAGLQEVRFKFDWDGCKVIAQ